MNTRDFCYWMQGYCELTVGKQPSNAQWAMIIEHMDLTNEVLPENYPLLNRIFDT